jgi:hypothetical protein
MIGDDGFLRLKFGKHIGLLSLVLACAAGCGGGGGGGGGAPPAGSAETSSTAYRNSANSGSCIRSDNSSPEITVTSSSLVVAGKPFNLAPCIYNPENVSLSFSATNLPPWASIDTSTGKITGTPDSGDVGTYRNIRITAFGDGLSATSPAFAVQVSDVASGAVTLTWLPPTQNADGSPLMDLAGYRIYYGQTPNQLDQSVTINNPGVTSFVIDNLTPAVWHFAATAYNSEGMESPRSNSTAKRVM